MKSSSNNRSCVSPILRRVFSRPTLHVPSPQHSHIVAPNTGKDDGRSGPRIHTEMPIRSGSSLSGVKPDLVIDVTTTENVQFMDQPLRGKIELSGLPAPIESVSISLKGVVKTCVASNSTWTSGFGGESNVTARFTEKEVLRPT